MLSCVYLGVERVGCVFVLMFLFVVWGANQVI